MWRSRLGPSFSERHWYRFSWLSAALAPAALVFGIGVALRRAAYRLGMLPIERLPVPVVIIGNHVIGGTGKTPLVLWLVNQLHVRGLRPGIILRGFGGENDRSPRAVPPNGDPAHYGDEPVLLAERSGAPVWIGRDRPAVGRALLAANTACDIVVCDDGLQHYRLARDFEIAVEDSRGFGNGLLLPAGPLRELPSRQVDAIVLNGVRARPGAFTMELVSVGLYRLSVPARAVEVGELRGKRLHAIAGIGNPARFFTTLESLGLEIIPHVFPDHHWFASRDLDYPDCDAVLMTEKDAVKCRAFGRDDLVALRVEARVEPGLADLILSRLHGRQTA